MLEYLRRIACQTVIGHDGVPEPPAVTVVVPTRNEAPNVATLVDRVAAACAGRFSWELLFVDDSDDTTPAEVLGAAVWAPVRVHHRVPGRRRGGLGGAVQEGLDLAQGRVVAVMDGDLQHPPEILPELVGPILHGWADLVAGSRYHDGGTVPGLSGRWRRLVSAASRRAVHTLVPRSRCLHDPMSGLFAFDPSVIEGTTLRTNGFKVLLEMTARGRAQRVHNLAYRFADRGAGRSKAGAVEGLRFAAHLSRLVAATPRLRPLPPVRPARLVVTFPGAAAARAGTGGTGGGGRSVVSAGRASRWPAG